MIHLRVLESLLPCYYSMKKKKSLSETFYDLKRFLTRTAWTLELTEKTVSVGAGSVSDGEASVAYASGSGKKRGQEKCKKSMQEKARKGGKKRCQEPFSIQKVLDTFS